MKKEIYFVTLLLITLASCKKNESESTIVYQDNLSVDKKTWLCDSSSNYVRKFYQGHYYIRTDTINRFGYSLAPYGTIDFPYSVQVDAVIQLDNPSDIGYVGIIFNHTDVTHFSIIQVDNTGEYFIWSYNNGNYATNAPLTYSPAIQRESGVKNTIKIIQSTTSVELQINNNTMGTFTLPIPTNYIQVGLLAGTVPSNSNYYTPVTGLFNNFIITEN